MTTRADALTCAIMTLLVCASATAQTAGAEALFGSWDADFQGMIKTRDMSDEERALANAMLGTASVTLTFSADGSMVMVAEMMGQHQTKRGTWRVLDSSGAAMSIETTTAAQGEATETQTFDVVLLGADGIQMAEEGGEAIPFVRNGSAMPAALAPSAAVAPALPNAVAVLLQQSWGEDCTLDTLGRSSVQAVDLNADGRTDYIVDDACSAGADDSDHRVFVDITGTFREVISHRGESLGLHDDTSEGYRELVGRYCDGWADCETSYYRWNGSAYERYRSIRDQQVE